MTLDHAELMCRMQGLGEVMVGGCGPSSPGCSMVWSPLGAARAGFGRASLGCCKTRAVKTPSAALLSFCEVRDVGTGTGILLAANSYRNEKQTVSPK